MIILPEYFKNNDTVFLARDLIGKTLMRRTNQQTQSYLITETEAYHGAEDKACHARFGKTTRNQVMFESGGRWYVYLCYGIHWLLNLITGEADHPAGILIRGVDQTFGPGKVTKLLQIDKQLYGKPALPESGLWIEDQGYVPQKIITTTRIGIDYAADYKDKPWRFISK